MFITPTAHDKTEWSRLAQAAYREGRNSIGHRFSAAASLPHDAPMTVAQFDALQGQYRHWLVFGWWR